MTNVLIIGATSAIAQATARRFAAEGARFFLVGRTQSKLDAVRDDLRVVGAAEAETYVLDLTEIDKHAAMLEAATTALGSLDAVLIAHGSLGDQTASETLVSEAMREWETNCTSVIALLTLLANELERQQHGTIAVISSVAGDRGRRSNYVYGAAKAALNVYLDGMRARLARAGVAVVTIKPGFVDTPMTADVPKNLLFASPERVAQDIHRAMVRGTAIVYTPSFWRYIMLLIRAIPDPIFRKLPL
jgi:decaprenylphospho-beta-D-erythro-pentofuranosid-2-ulose 2-reductase